jgi:para-nitrobenzyl esterase
LPDRSYKYPPVDGYVLPDTPLNLLASGPPRNVSIVMSTTTSEFATIYDLDRFPELADDDAYRAFLRDRFGPTFGDAVMGRYPSQDYGSPKQAAIAALGDVVYVCPTRRALRVIARVRPGAAWRAVYDHVFEEGSLRPYGAAHGFDMLLGFHDMGTYPLTAAEQALADTIAGVWQSLAETGDPSRAGGVGAWRPYDLQIDNAVIVNDPVGSATGIRSTLCDFWDRGR